MAHPNEESLQRGYEAFGQGDIDTVMSLFTDDILWHIPGRNQLSGDYRGKDEVGGFFMKLNELTSGTFKVDVHDILANDERGVALVILSGERNGKTLAANDAHIWHVRDGLWAEFYSHLWDQYEFDEFWS